MLNSILKEKTIIHCPTPTEAKQCLELLRDAGYMWLFKKPIQPEDSNWEIYSTKTGYVLAIVPAYSAFKDSIGVTTIDNKICKKYKIISFSEWKASLTNQTNSEYITKLEFEKFKASLHKKFNSITALLELHNKELNKLMKPNFCPTCGKQLKGELK